VSADAPDVFNVVNVVNGVNVTAADVTAGDVPAGGTIDNRVDVIDRSARPSARSGRALLITAALATFLGAALGFSVQPLVSRQLLPLLGGGASVWNTTLVFFQAVLLLGYLFTHLTSTRLSPRQQMWVHLAVLAAGVVVLPVGIPKGWSPPTTGNPAWWLLSVLVIVVGLPYLAVATTSPLVQKWFSGSEHQRGSDPYFLYAISNVGSFVGLLALPLGFDRTMRLGTQSRWWSALYGVFLATCAAVAILARVSRSRALVVSAVSTPAESVRIGRSQWFGWAALAFVPSSLILGVSSHLTTDVASVPLLWVLPLGLYLLTHVIAFSRFTIPPWALRLFAGAAAGLAASALLVDLVGFPWKLIPDLVALFFIGLACHGRLAEQRPPASKLTSFYVALSVGGVAGGMFNALLAPVIFKRVIEYPVVLIVSALLIGGVMRQRQADGEHSLLKRIDLVSLSIAVPLTFAAISAVRWLSSRPVIFAIVVSVLVAVLLAYRRGVLGAVIVATVAVLSVRDMGSAAVRFERSFYGAVSVEEDGEFRSLVHGTTIHGYQFLDPAKRSTPTSYYGEPGAVGQLIRALKSTPDSDSQTGQLGDIAVVGLGVGTIASYLEPEDTLTYYEIDPLIVRLAKDRSLFTYLSDTKGSVNIVLGDGRRRLREADSSYRLLALDAFTSDAIPMHLLTVEAFETYVERLAPDGVLAVHVSNRYLDLEPVVAKIGQQLDLSSVVGHFVASDEDEAAGTTSSDWIVLSRSPSALAALKGGIWSPVRTEDSVRAWTDDRSDILSVLITG
jgi:hypothetical protein